jgi:hypothetical protein
VVRGVLECSATMARVADGLRVNLQCMCLDRPFLLAKVSRRRLIAISSVGHISVFLNSIFTLFAVKSQDSVFLS